MRKAGVQRTETGLQVHWWRLPDGHLAESSHGARLTPYATRSFGTAQIQMSLGEAGTFKAGTWQVKAGAPALIVVPASTELCVRKEPSDAASWRRIEVNEDVGSGPRTLPYGHPAWDLFAGVSAALRNGDGVEIEQMLVHLLESVQEKAAPVTPCQRAAGLARDLIHTNYGQPQSLNGLAAACGVSRAHLVRSFRHLTGSSPAEYLREVRMQAARRSLLAGQSVAETAFACGYESLPTFTHAFRSRFGCPPAQWRSRNDPLR